MKCDHYKQNIIVIRTHRIKKRAVTWVAEIIDLTSGKAVIGGIGKTAFKATKVALRDWYKQDLKAVKS